VAIRKEIDIKTDNNAKLTKSNRRTLAAQNKTHGNGKRAKIHHASKGLFVKRASKKKLCHSYTDVTVVKDHLSYREDAFHLPHTKRILLSDLEVFEVRDVGKSGLVIGVAEEGCETMVAYVVSERQCQEVSQKRWKTHLENFKKAEKEKPTGARSLIKKACTFNTYNCYEKRKDPLSGAVSDYAYKRKTSEKMKTECTMGLQYLLNDIEYLTSRGLRLLLSSSEFKYVQDRYQLPTAFDSKEKYANGIAFAVGCDYWSAIHVDDNYYYTSLSCISESVNDRSILLYFFFPTYGMAFPMYSGSIMCFNLRFPHGMTDPTKKGVHIFSAYVSAKTCDTHHAFMHI
jgi:hypothetical protein